MVSSFTKLAALFFVLFFLLFGFVKQTNAQTLYEGINTNLAGDDANQSIPIGFTFNFYGNNYTTAFVNINGMLSFGTGYSDYSNTSIPNASTPNNFIAAFWDDLITQGYERRTIYYYTTGTAPNRKLIVQWTNMYFFSNPTLQMGTFQTILYENSNLIHTQYVSLQGSAAAFGNSANIGVENSSGNAGVQYSNNTASLTDGQCISYTPNAGSYTINSSATCDNVLLFDANAPAVPTLLLPGDGANEESLVPTFTWDEANNADTYTLLVATDANFANIVVNQTGLTTMSYSYNGVLNSDSTYYWRVQSVNETTTALSDVRSFTTRHAPRVLSLGPSAMVNGSFTANNQPQFTFSITDSNGAHTVQYRIEIDNTSNFSSPEVDYTSALGAPGAKSFTVGQLPGTGSYAAGSAGQTLANGNYYWRVTATDSINEVSPTSTANNGGIAFRVLNGNPDISGISVNPSDTGAVITWTTSQEGSTKVDYGRITSYGFTTNETNTSPRVTSHSVTLTNLTPCSRYFYRVRSKNAANAEKVSDQQTFSKTGCITTITEGSEEDIPVSSGGTINYTNGSATVTLNVPENFASNDSTFQINRLQPTNIPTPPPSRNLVSNHLYDFSAVTDDSSEITTFDEPLTLVINYGDDIEETYVENTLDLFKYMGNDEWESKSCVLDTEANTLTCTMESFSTYGVFGELQPNAELTPTPASARSAPEAPKAKAPVCANLPPQGSIDLFQIDTNDTKATIHFTPVNNNISEYFISYTMKKDEYMYGVNVPYGHSDGAIVYTINDLPPNSTFYVQVRAGNGCASGIWSNQVEFKTGSTGETKTTFYK